MKLKKIFSIFNRKYKLQWILATGIILIVGFIFFRGDQEPTTLLLRLGDFVQEVSVSGKIIATEDIDLSFEQSGQVRGVYVREGDVVKAGSLLVNQDTLQLEAQLAEMRAGINLQKAKLSQLLAGAEPEDIRVSENEVTLATQNVSNAYDDALTVLDDVYTTMYNVQTTIVTIQNTYFSTADQQGVKVQESKGKIKDNVTNAKNYLTTAKGNPSHKNVDETLSHFITYLNTIYTHLAIIREQCDEGIYYALVPTANKSSLDTQKTNINAALNDIKSSQQDIANYKIDLEQALNELALKKAPPREADIAVFEAQIDQAKASEKNILAQLRKRQIFAPINGLVAKVNVKLGSVSSTSEPAVSIISQDPYLIESYVPEIYIPLVKIGDEAKITLDAYTEGTSFLAKVVSIDPAETIKDGVATYRTKLKFDGKDERVRSGMTANVVITTEKKSNVLSVPQGIVIDKEGKKVIKVREGKEVIEREVTTGLFSSSGQVEILSGLKEGEVVIVQSAK